MATQSRGKKFESRFKQDFEETVDDSLCYRLVDVTSGYFGVRNISDFFCYKYPLLFVIDCKSSDSNTFSVDFRQYDDMLKLKDIKGLHIGVIWWSIPNDGVVWIPIQTFEKIKKEGGKSFNFKKMINDDNYESLLIPSKKLRTFLKSDYSSLIEYYNEKEL